jgi:GNAT superfamily N-acetyltransferase
LLFRRIANPSFTPSVELELRNGIASDAEAIAEIDDGFFANLSEIQSYAEKGGLFALQKEGQTIGCGIATCVVAGRPAIDVGMWVAPNHRRKGYGSYIVSFLKDHYLKRGLRPICGCSSQNVASHRALRAAGFVSSRITSTNLASVRRLGTDGMPPRASPRIKRVAQDRGARSGGSISNAANSI